MTTYTIFRKIAEFGVMQEHEKSHNFHIYVHFIFVKFKHNHRHPKINRFDICISNLAFGLTHSLAFKRYTQI